MSKKNRREGITKGRPPLWANAEELQKDLDRYYEHALNTNEPILMVGFAVFMNTTKGIVHKYSGMEGFKIPLAKLKTRADLGLMKGGLQGTYSASFAMFLAKNNHGYVDKVEMKQDINSVVDNNLTVTFHKA